jgi:hypothetical protein
MIGLQMMGSAFCAALAMIGAAPAMAQSASPPPPETLRLTPQEKADIVAHQTEASVDAARAGLAGSGSGRQVHGEIGAAAGTHGLRDLYGTATIPLGDHASATVGFDDSRYGSHR